MRDGKENFGAVVFVWVTKGACSTGGNEVETDLSRCLYIYLYDFTNSLFW